MNTPTMSTRSVLTFSLKLLAVPAWAFVWHRGGWDDRVVLVCATGLMMGINLGGWKASKEMIGKVLVLLGMLGIALVLTVRFVVPYAVDEVQRQVSAATTSAVEQARADVLDHLPTWAKR